MSSTLHDNPYLGMPFGEALADTLRDDVRVDWISVEVGIPIVHELLLREIQVHSVLEFIKRSPLQGNIDIHRQCYY